MRVFFTHSLLLLAAGSIGALTTACASADPTPPPAAALAVALAVAPPSAAPTSGETLTLVAAVAEAMRQRPLLQQGRERIGLAQARIQEVRSRLRPQVDFEASAVDGPQSSPPIGLRRPGGSLYSEHASAALTLVLTLLDFGRTHSLVRARREELVETQEALEADRNQVTLDVARGYIQALQARRLVVVNQQLVEQRQLVVRQAETLLENGLSSRVDVDLARLNVSQAQLALVRAQTEVNTAFALLSQSMGRVVPTNTPLQEFSGGPSPARSRNTDADTPPVTPSFVEGASLPDESLPTLDDSIGAALQNRPEIRSATARIRAADHLIAAARAEKRPTVAAVGAVGKLNPQPLLDARDQPYSIGLAITIPVFTGGLLESQVEQARRNARITQEQLAEITNTVRQQVTTAVANLFATQESLRVAEAQLTQAQDALNLATERYRSQLGSIIELSQAQLAYAAAQNDLVRAQYDRELARAALAYATGRGTAQPEGKLQ